MYMSGAIFIDRGNSSKAHKSLEAAGEEMKREGISLMMYPEGTRHIEEVPTLLPFKKGAFHLAVQAGLPITPVVCENYWRLYHKGVFGTGVIKVRGQSISAISSPSLVLESLLINLNGGSSPTHSHNWLNGSRCRRPFGTHTRANACDSTRHLCQSRERRRGATGSTRIGARTTINWGVFQLSRNR